MMAMPPTAIVATKPSHAARRKQERLENVFLNAVKVVAPFGGKSPGTRIRSGARLARFPALD
jgi:hypothetical protein